MPRDTMSPWLLFKARLHRAKDEEDFAATLPTLGVDARRWLYDTLSLTEPGHPWIAQVRPQWHDDVVRA